MGEGRLRVAYPYLFEPSAASQVSLELLRGFDEMWVPSAFAADIVRERLGREVRLVPPPLIFDRPRPLSSDGSEELRIVTCFDSRFEDQQDPLGAIKVFRAAFPVARDVRLEVICRGRASAKSQSSLLKVIADDDRISITSVPEHGASTAFDRTKGQVLISLHRTDVPPFDIANALARNMVVLATDWGHSTDLLTSSTGFPISCGRKLTGTPDQKLGPGDWVEPDFDLAVSELLHISLDFPSAHLRGVAGRDLVLREYSQMSVGDNLRRVLNAASSRYSLDG